VSSQHCVCGVCFSSPSHNSQYSHNTEPADSILFCELCAFCDTLVALDQDFEYRCELLGAVTDVASWRRTDVAPSCSFNADDLPSMARPCLLARTAPIWFIFLSFFVISERFGIGPFELKYGKM
jgi:hypothetical protein